MIRMISVVLVLLAAAMVCAQATQPQTQPKAPDAPRVPAKRAEPEQKPRPNDVLVYVRLETNRGNIDLELNQTRAPISVKNFLAYVDSGHYDGTIFHRVMKNFVVQGGGVSADLTEKATLPPIKNETSNGLKNMRATIAMARTNALDSATSQFYFNLRWNDKLDIDGGLGGYAVFGRVLSGMDLIDAIAQERTVARGQHQNVPVKSMEILKARRITKDEIPVAGDAAATAPADPPATAPGGARGPGLTPSK